ncbi:YybH family protein [Geodermatophilus sp. SYSU D01186]
MSRSDIDALNATFIKGVEKKDAAMMASVYAPDGRVLAPGTPAVEGRAAIEEFWKGMLDQGVESGTLKTLTLVEQGDLAVEEGQYEIRAGGAVVDTGKYVVVHRRQPDGSWKFGIDIFNSDQPSPQA